MDNNLKFWKKRKYLTLEQAAFLALDEDPDLYFYGNGGRNRNELRGFKSALEDLVNGFLDLWKNPISEDWIRDEEIFDGSYSANDSENNPFAFKDVETEFSFNPDLKVKQIAIKKWLKLKGIQSQYFDSYKCESQLAKNTITWQSLFTNPPKREGEVFTAIKDELKKYIENNTKLPTREDLWESLKENPNYNYEKKVIKNLTSSAFNKESFNSNFRRWTKNDK